MGLKRGYLKTVVTALVIASKGGLSSLLIFSMGALR